MGRAICRCGQQIRTNAKSGAKVQCPRCETWLTVFEKVFDPDKAMDEKRIDSDPGILLRDTHARESSEKIGASVGHNDATGIGRIVIVSLLVAIPVTIMLWAYFSFASSSKKLPRVEKADSLRTAEVRSQGWGQIDWKVEFEALPKGAQVKQIASKIADTGMLLDPGRFWDQLDVSAFEKNVRSPGGSLVAYQEKMPIKEIIDGLKTIPLDSVSETDLIGACKWDVIGVHPGPEPESIGVLIRYFNEPIELSKLVMSEAWISEMSKMLSLEEYFNVAKDLYARRSGKEFNRGALDRQQSLQEQVYESIFTPYFGYMVLIFKSSSSGVLWSDTVAIPSEVRLSRACGTMLQKDWYAFRKRVSVEPQRVPEGWTAEGLIDIFGEYNSLDEQSFGREIVFGDSKPDSETVVRIERAIPSISPSRSKELVSVAIAATSNYGRLKESVSAFRKIYPKDIGVDALLLSIWMRHHSSSRSAMTFGDFGEVFVDAADRLYAKHKDPILFDIKARIYWSHGQRQPTDEQLALAERFGNASAFYFQRRIESSLENNDKAKALSYLSKFSTFWLGQPGVVLESDPNSSLKKLHRTWGN